MLARFAGLTLSRCSGSHFSCVLKNDFEKKKTTVLFSMAEMNQMNDSLKMLLVKKKKEMLLHTKILKTGRVIFTLNV